MARAPEWAERTSSHSAWAPLVVLLPAVVVLSDNAYGAFMDEIGSFKDAPLIGPNDAKTQLDLIPRDAEPPVRRIRRQLCGLPRQHADPPERMSVAGETLGSRGSRECRTPSCSMSRPPGNSTSRAGPPSAATAGASRSARKRSQASLLSQTSMMRKPHRSAQRRAGSACRAAADGLSSHPGAQMICD